MKNKVAIVTGSGKGIGKAISEAMAGAGMKVVVNDISEEAGSEVVEKITSQGGTAFFVQADLLVENQIEDLVERTVERYGRLDFVINNARPPLRLLPFGESLSEWDMAMGVLLKAPALMAKYSQRHLADSGGGAIVNVGSTNAYFISHQPASYHVAKAGLLQLTRYLASEFGPQKIRVNAICPGVVDTSEGERSGEKESFHKRMGEITVPLGRFGSPREVAEAVLFLCSDASRYMTGQSLILDGGITLGDHYHIARKALLRGEEDGKPNG